MKIIMEFRSKADLRSERRLTIAIEGGPDKIDDVVKAIRKEAENWRTLEEV